MSATSLDDLYKRVAQKVLKETVHLRKGEAVTVEAWTNGLGFARHAVAEARAMGCTAIMIFEDEGAYVEGVRRAPKDSLGLMGKNEYGLLSATDAYIFVPGQALGVYSKTLKPKELSDSTRYNSSWYDAAKKAGLRGARLVFGYVGRDMAGMLGKTVSEITARQLKAGLTDYRKISRDAGQAAAHLDNGMEVTVESSGTKLRFRVKGELEIEDGIIDDKDLADGNNVAYVPPGLVTKQVDPDSVEGKVKVSQSLTRYGVLAGAELEFKGGTLTSWRAQDKAKLERLLATVPIGKRKLTLLGVGVNPELRYGFGQDRFVRGSVTLSGLGFTAVLRKSDLSSGGSRVVSQGVLVAGR
ncbi:MAG: aminopeptidase [Nitrososphaerales archaeon]|nr:aminopeptidase [Nitrososphaerales archaeon]